MRIVNNMWYYVLLQDLASKIRSCYKLTMENKDLELVKKLRPLAKSTVFKPILEYFAHNRTVASKSSDVYSVLKYAENSGASGFKASDLKDFFRTLHGLGVGEFFNTRTFEWMDFNPINVCQVALGETHNLIRSGEGGFQRQQRIRRQKSSILIGDLDTNNILNGVSEAQLVDELERRGWKVSLQRKQKKA